MVAKGRASGASLNNPAARSAGNLCHEQGTVSAYILRRRLEECARELGDPKLGDQSITDIAFGWGLNSGPHFTRSFRNRFPAVAARIPRAVP